MKLERLRVGQFRKFGTAVEISGLEDGLNVFHGPNEAGKSTLADALRTLFYERHRTGGSVFAASIAPDGSTDAAPSVDAWFRLGGVPCHAHKTFLQAPRARLSIGDERWEGEAADEELARRLGFSLAARGPSREETRGIPGLLWIGQGDSQRLAEPLDHARGTLQERLQEIIGDIASSAGERVAAAVEAELRNLRTPTGREKGVLVQIAGELEAARKEQAQLQALAERYAGLVDQLARDTARFQALERERPWETIAAQRQAAQEQLAQLEPLRAELVDKQAALEEVRQRHEHLAAQRQARADALAELQRQRQELEQAQATSQALAQRLARVQAGQDDAAQARNAAAQALRVAEQAAERRRLQDEAARCQRQAGQARKVLEKVAAESAAIARLRSQAATLALPDGLLDALRTCEAALQENRIRREAVATRIRHRLQPGIRVSASGHADLHGEGEVLAGTATTLRIEGVGEIEIIPGGDDVQRLASDAQRLDAERHRLLGEAGVASLEAAEQRQRQWQQLQEEIGTHERARDIALAGEDEDHWQQELAAAQGKAQQVQDRLQALPEADPGALPLDEAQRRRDDAEAADRAAGTALRQCQDELGRARLVLERLQAQVDAGSHNLEGEQARRLDARELAQQEKDQAQMTRLAAAIAQREQALREHDPDQLQADIDRFGRSLQAIEHERGQLRDRITATRSQLETLGMDGIDEKLAAASFAVQRLQQRHDQYQLRARALQLLHDRIQASQRALTGRLYAPLRQRLEHYLGMLFPGVAAQVGIEQLSPTTLARSGPALALEAHSHGTREQLGVLARFAYADLLRQAGQPTLLVLDDALVHSDPGRLARMKRIVDDAASRHQILLFTCHADAWRDAGARRFIDVAALA